jgi:hypothetical protein
MFGPVALLGLGFLNRGVPSSFPFQAVESSSRYLSAWPAVGAPLFLATVAVPRRKATDADGLARDRVGDVFD